MKIDKSSLFEKLQKAVELELATIPPYLTAVFSIYRDKNRIPASIIRSVFMEEMLHLTLAGNILSAVGGKVKLGKSNIPKYPLRMEFEGKKFRDREFDVNLARLSKPTIKTFCDIEMPDWEKVTERAIVAKGFVVDGYTIGEFYEEIKSDLRKMCKKYPDRDVFSGNPAHQISEDYYWGGGGKPIVVRTLKHAIEAIDEIIEQGEGSDGSRMDGDKMFDQREEIAHYFRFNEILHGKYYKPSDGIQDPPSGKKLPVDYKAVYPIKPNCKVSDFEETPELAKLNEEFNLKYSTMLAQLEDGFNGNPKVFYTAIMNGMHDLSPIAYKMVQIKIKGKKGLDAKGKRMTGAPSFEWVEPKIITVKTKGKPKKEKNWHVIQSIELASDAGKVWDVVGGFFTIHTWHPDIATTEISKEQNTEKELRRLLTFSNPPGSLTTEQLEFLDNENLYYKYKWVAGAWGEAVKNYKSEIRVIEMVPGKTCMVQWSSTFLYTEDAVSVFYRNGFKALEKIFGVPKKSK